MHTHEIDFFELIRRVLPLHLLPPDLAGRLQAALLARDAEEAERAALAALRELEARGLVRAEGGRSGERRYVNLTTGAAIVLRAPRPAAGRIEAVPCPVLPGGAPASIEITRELLSLAGRILSEDGTRVAEHEQLIQLLLSFTRQVVPCDEARYLSLNRDAPDGFTPIAGSGSPFATQLTDDWDAARGSILLIRDLASLSPPVEPPPAIAGASGPLLRSAAVVRIGRPGDRLRGAIEVWAARPGHFTRERLAVLELIAETGRELLRNATQLQELVFIDSRTQIFNKAFFDIQFQNLLARARREGLQMALAIIDVDDFRAFNTRYGYAGGDQVLARVALTLKGQVRPFDCVARWGGEEFTVVLAPPVDADDALMICERLRRAVQQATVQIQGLDRKEHRGSVTVSIGGALYPHDGSSTEDLWRRANEALLSAKAAGKNRVHFRLHERRDQRVAPA
jgi:diguanylate cyclase (GGDEF)-like protein